MEYPRRNLNATDKYVGYSKLAENFVEFENLGRVPLGVDVLALNKGAELKETFVAREAKWHKTYYFKFSNSRLERAKKRSCTKTGTKEILSGLVLKRLLLFRLLLILRLTYYPFQGI